jgi:hypothetical protein
VIAYSTENYTTTQDVEEVVERTEKKHKNQLLLSKEEIEKMKSK